MNADERRLQLNRLTEKIIGCAYLVSNKLGTGFLEKVYENALAIEIRRVGLRVAQQTPLAVHYDEFVVGEFVTDLLIEDQVIIELKASKGLDTSHIAQCMNYLKATGLSVCLLINFGKPKAEIKRIVRDF